MQTRQQFIEAKKLDKSASQTKLEKSCVKFTSRDVQKAARVLPEQVKAGV